MPREGLLMSTTEIEYAEQIASNSSNWTINQFKKALTDKSLHLRPPFQRNLVWNDDQKSFLVDSILRGLPVPEIYVQVSTSADGDESIVVVDGQQRISACLSFLGDTLRLTGDKDFDVRWRGRMFSELDPDLQKRFRSYELIVRKLPDLGETILREVFRRLNKTVEPLMPQELRHAAYTGPLLKLVERAGAFALLSEIGVFSAKDYLRRRSDELMSEISLALISGAFPNKKEGLDELFLAYERQGAPPGVLEELSRRLGRVFAQLEGAGSLLRRSRFRNKSDFYSLVVLLGNEAERLPLPPEDTETLTTRLREFSSLVNDIKREETEGHSIDPLVDSDLGATALKYLRAVERAASDRLSRVRRDEALRAVLGSIIAAGQVRELSDADVAWMWDAVDEETDEDDESSTDAEKVHLQKVLGETDPVI
jgi:hypothetical protein